MLIISKHKDYYDSAVGMGIDKTIVYNRDEKSIELESGFWAYRDKNPKIVTDIMDAFYLYTETFTGIKRDIGFQVISFCGKIHIGFVFSNLLGSDDDGKENGEDHEVVFYGKDDVIEAYKKAIYKHSNHYWGRSNLNYKANLSALNNAWDKIAGIDTTETHREYDTPVFVVKCRDHFYNPKMILNPILKQYDFVKLYDPYTTFQEIQMYLSGVLASGDDVAETKMNEKQKVNQHGFDDKYGFRTRPGKGKKRKK